MNLNLSTIVKQMKEKYPGIEYEFSQSSFTLHEDDTSTIIGLDGTVVLDEVQTLKYLLGTLTIFAFDR